MGLKSIGYQRALGVNALYQAAYALMVLIVSRLKNISSNYLASFNCRDSGDSNEMRPR